MERLRAAQLWATKDVAYSSDETVYMSANMVLVRLGITAFLPHKSRS